MGQTVTERIQANKMTFNCRLAGDPEAEPVIFLHGWPETSYMWIPLMEGLSKQGYYCIAPDQRGFSAKARPEKVKDYDIRLLAADIVALADALGLKQFHLIGHDWGAAIGWAVVTLYPERIKSWTAMSVPHLKAFSDAIRNDPQQRKMSRYMAFFQWRGIPEWYLLRNDRANLRRIWKKSPPDQLEEYLHVLGNRPALRASLNYYRANYRTLKKGAGVNDFGAVNTPTLMLWGRKDLALGQTGIDATGQYVKGPYERIDLDAGHWLIQEDPDTCYKAILKHLDRNH